MNTEVKCPCCKKMDFIPAVTFRNVESYGDKTYVITCNFCAAKVAVQMERVVVCRYAIPSQKTTDDWGG